MRVLGLISGGKDSLYNMIQCIAAGHEIVAIGNIEPKENIDELDSYMYQTIAHQTLSLLSAAMCLPIYRQKTKGIAVCKEKIYMETVEDEVEDLYTLLSKVKDEIHIDGVSVGAIESDYQRTRVENVCFRLNLKCLAYLWKRNQEELLQEMIDADINAIVVKVAAIGLKPEEHLGLTIKDFQPILLKLNEKFGVHICGEGGEYETLTVDCPLYYRKIEINESEILIHSDDAFAPIAYLNIKNATLEEKALRKEIPNTDYIKSVIKSPLYYIQDCLDEFMDEESPESRIDAPYSSEVLPFPFGCSSKMSKPANESKGTMSAAWKNKSDNLRDSYAGAVKFYPSSLIITDTSITQLNMSTGWCCIGNVMAPNITDGFNSVQKHLRMYQFELQDIVSISIYVKDMGEWSKMNKIYSQIFSSRCLPTRACVAVPLPSDVAIAITVVAHRLVSKTQKIVHYTQHSVDREHIHVQSISHWAPASIGPYSQCVRVGEIVYVAGQIPLVPGTMELLNRPILQQCRLTLRHIFRILTAMNSNYSFANIIHGICFVISEKIAAEISHLWSYITKNEHAAIAIVVVSSLPKSADLEWQVQACGHDSPQVTAGSENISEELTIKYKRCLYKDQNISSLVCDVSFVKETSKKNKSGPHLTSENLIVIVRQCVQILKGDMVTSGARLCMLNMFFKVTETAVALAVSDSLKNTFDIKVVLTSIPVVACVEPSVLLTISGICH